MEEDAAIRLLLLLHTSETSHKAALLLLRHAAGSASISNLALEFLVTGIAFADLPWIFPFFRVRYIYFYFLCLSHLETGLPLT